MNENNDNPELKTSLRHAYRSETVSPYFAKRVMANVKGKKRSFSLWPKIAAGLTAVALISILVVVQKETKTINDVNLTAQTSTQLKMPAFRPPEYSSSDLDVPSLSSVIKIPTLNRFNVPAVSVDSSGDFCVYKQSGEMSC